MSLKEVIAGHMQIHKATPEYLLCLRLFLTEWVKVVDQEIVRVTRR